MIKTKGFKVGKVEKKRHSLTMCRRPQPKTKGKLSTIDWTTILPLSLDIEACVFYFFMVSSNVLESKPRRLVSVGNTRNIKASLDVLDFKGSWVLMRCPYRWLAVAWARSQSTEPSAVTMPAQRPHKIWRNYFNHWQTKARRFGMNQI